MEKLLNLVIDSVPEDATIKTIFLFFLFAFFIYSISQANAIYDFVDKLNKRELSVLRDLLADKNISEKAKIVLRDKIDSIAYKKVTKVTANTYWQKRIINHYELAEGRLNYSDFRRAFTFLKIDKNGLLKVEKPNKVDRFFQLFWVFVSVFVFLILTLLSLIYVYGTISIWQRIIVLFLIIIAYTMLLLSSLQASLINVAKKIREEIEPHNLKSQQLRPYGLCEGEFTVPDDFDAPLPEDILKTFEGK